MNRVLGFVGVAVVTIIAVLSVLLVRTNAALTTSESDKRSY
ncbi:hypothetical protein [Citrobacter werkmanii]|nr:hypothetical protein [Citrobacter werkmanii]